MHHQLRLALICFGLASLLLVGCASGADVSKPTAATGPTAVAAPASQKLPPGKQSSPAVVSPPAPQAKPSTAGVGAAEAAVRKTYDALARKDRNAYLDSLEPAARNVTGATVSAALNIAAEMLLGASVDFQDISFRDMKYTTKQSFGSWVVVEVTGYVRNVQLATESPIDAVEVARRLGETWYTSTPALFASSPEGKSYAAELERRAMVGRKLVKVVKSEPMQSDDKDVWWPVTIENGDTTPHKVKVSLLNAETGAPMIAQNGSAMSMSGNIVEVRPLGTAVVKPGTFKTFLPQWPTEVRAVVASVDGKLPLMPEEIWPMITVDRAVPARTRRYESEGFGATWFQNQVTCDLRINYTGLHVLGASFEFNGTRSRTERGDVKSQRFIWRFSGLLLPGGGRGSWRIGPLSTNEIPDKGAIAPFTTYKFNESQPLPRGETVEFTSLRLTIGGQDGNSFTSTREFPIEGFKATVPEVLEGRVR